MNNSFMVVKGAIADDGLRKDFSKRGRVPPKNSQAERSRGPVWSIIDKNDSEDKDRVPPLPRSQTRPR